MSAPGDIQLVLSDVDGTLVTNDKVLTDAAKTAVRDLKAAGIGFTITSSRPPRGLCMLIEPLGLSLPIAGFNGGLIVRPDLSVIESHPIDPAVARRGADFLHAQGLDVWVYGQDQWFTPSADGPHVAREAWILGFGPTVAADLAEAHLARAFKIVGVSDDARKMAEAEEAAPAVLGQSVSATRSAAHFLDITHPLASKAEVVDALARQLNIPPARIATIGDMPNDVLMFRESGFSIAMGNASDLVRRQAHAITDTNQKDGFAKAMRELILARAAAGAIRDAGARS
jgi:hypothetical protein